MEFFTSSGRSYLFMKKSTVSVQLIQYCHSMFTETELTNKLIKMCCCLKIFQVVQRIICCKTSQLIISSWFAHMLQPCSLQGDLQHLEYYVRTPFKMPGYFCFTCLLFKISALK